MKTISPATRTTPSVSSYAAFVAGLKLVGLGLKSSSTSLDRQLLWELGKREKGVARELVENYEPTEIGKGFFEAVGRYDFTVADGGAVALKINCVFEVHLHSDDPIDPLMAAHFAKTDLRFILLPYARHFVTDLTGRMQIPPIVLPLATAATTVPPKRIKERTKKRD